MGLDLGGSTSESSGQQQQSTTNANTYSPWQTALQSLLGSSLSSQLSGASSGTLSPDVQAMEDNSANQINATAKSGEKNLNQNLAARGFGDSGATESGALATELGRQGSLAQNQSNFAGLQLNQNQNFLSDSLMAAFNAMGNTQQQQGTESASGSSLSGGASASIPGL
jgi:hypothetical protein